MSASQLLDDLSVVMMHHPFLTDYTNGQPLLQLSVYQLSAEVETVVFLKLNSISLWLKMLVLMPETVKLYRMGSVFVQF